MKRPAIIIVIIIVVIVLNSIIITIIAMSGVVDAQEQLSTRQGATGGIDSPAESRRFQLGGS